MIISWNMTQIITELQKCYFATTDPRQDGFTSWRCKQDLYKVKFALDEMIEQCPHYHGEDEWVAKEVEIRDKKKVWRRLSEV